jgi:tetratricopeptide (TPR) repeat protein
MHRSTGICRAASRKGDYDFAIADFDRAVELDDKYAQAYINRGYAYAAKREFGPALADYDAALKLEGIVRIVARIGNEQGRPLKPDPTPLRLLRKGFVTLPN